MNVDGRAVLEAGYGGASSEDAWLQGLAQAARGTAISCFAYSFDSSTSSFSFGSCAQDGDYPPKDAWWPLLRAWAQSQPGSHLEVLYKPSRPVLSLRRATATGVLRNSELVQLMDANAMRDVTMVVCSDPTARGVVFGYANLTPRELSPRTVASLGQVAAHVAAARRLQARLVETDFVVTPSGKVEDAVDRSPRMIDAVIESVRRRERARNIRVPEAEALALWHAMVRERWTLIDQVDRDGKRYVLARRNTVLGPASANLTTAERQVVAFACQGHAYKYIAYELGISVSAVRSRLKHAMRKLGVKTVRDLIMSFRAGI